MCPSRRFNSEVGEEWKTVVGTWKYLVSNLGRVRRAGKSYCLKMPLKGGYPTVCIHGKCLHVHRLVLDAFVGTRPPGMECRHLDGNPANCNLSNLKWGTPKENGEDRAKHGTWSNGGISVKGEANPRAILTKEQARQIIRLYRNKKKRLKDIASMYGVSIVTVSLIGRGKAWSHLAEAAGTNRYQIND